jgi:peptide-methionine (R)-S-oxide reductase
MSPNKIIKTDAEWRAQLGDFEFKVLREAETERPWTGELLEEKRAGIYRCRACGAELFRSDTKFDSHCGWPSFFKAENDAVTLIEDNTLGMVRVEARCAACDSHLGHVFPDAPQTPTGDRFCINSVSLTFDEGDADADSAAGGVA